MPLLLGILPVQQSLFIFYAYFMKDGLFNEYFIHNNLVTDSSIIWFLLNYCVYLFFILVISSSILKIAKIKYNSIQNINISTFNFSIEKLIIVYVVLSVLFLSSTALDGFTSKVSRIAYYYLSFVPILVGYFVKTLEKKVLALFGVVSLLFVGINILAGSRGYLAIIAISFTLGVLANNENKNIRRYYFTVITVIAIIIFPLLSFVEQFRTENERLDYKEVNADRLNSLVTEYQENNNTDKKNDGIARLITWPTLSVLLLTEVSVPTVGFENIKTDISFVFSNTFITGKSVEESRENYIENLWGTSPANLYDYNVSFSNSVEFSVLADGVWRYGQFGYFYNLLILLLIGIMLENFIAQSVKKNSITSFKLFILGNTYLIFYNLIGAEPLISILRSIFNNLVFSFIFSKLIDFYLRKNRLMESIKNLQEV